jgi:hypothetical protein
MSDSKHGFDFKLSKSAEVFDGETLGIITSRGVDMPREECDLVTSRVDLLIEDLMSRITGLSRCISMQYEPMVYAETDW